MRILKHNIFQRLKNGIIAIMILLCFTCFVQGQTTFTSVQTGNWGNGATWDQGTPPGTGDNAVVSGTHTVTVDNPVTINNLVINSNAVLTHRPGNRPITINGNYTVNGTHSGPGNTSQFFIRLEGSNTEISGSGTISNSSTVRIRSDKTILPGTNLTRLNGNIRLDNNLTVTNLGTLTLRGNLTAGGAGFTWNNATGSTLRIEGALLATGTLIASAENNKVAYIGTSDQNIKLPQSGQYYHLEIRGGGNKLLQANTTVKGNLTITSTLQSNGQNLSVQGNWNNTGSFSAGTERVTFSGAKNQELTGSGTQSLYNFTLNKTDGKLNLSVNLQINNSATFENGIIHTASQKVIIGTGTGNTGTVNANGGYVEGFIERWITQTGTPIVFPVGSDNLYRPATITFNNLTGGSMVGRFLTDGPGSAGLPLLDDTVDVYNTFNEGYWTLTTANSLSTNDYDLQLEATGFTSFDIVDFTRLLSRKDETSDWLANGTHVAAWGDTVQRAGLSTSPSQLSAQYALGDTTSCDQPETSSISGATALCTGTTGQKYSVTSAPGISYEWMVTGGTITAGQGTNEITVDWGNTGMIGEVRLRETNDCSPGPWVSLPVRIDPVPPSLISGPTSIAAQTDNVTYSVSSVTGYTYSWNVSGGTIVSGQGSNTIEINWGGAGSGYVSVKGNHTCGTSDSIYIDVSIFAVINSIATGNWGNAATWDCNCVPQAGNSVRIRNPHTVTLSNQPTEITNITIAAGATLNNSNRRFFVLGDYINNGTHAGTQRTEVRGDMIDGNGTITQQANFELLQQNKTIPSSANLTFTNGNLIVGAGRTIVNNGTITVNNNVNGNDGNSVWINEAGSGLNVSGELLNTGSLQVSSSGNTVNYNGGANQTIKTPQGAYHNLILSGNGTKTQAADLTINNNLTISSTLDAAGNNIELGGNWNNTGTFTPGTGRVTMNGASLQQIANPAGEQFYNFRVSKSGSRIKLEDNVTIANELTLQVGAIETNGNLLTLGTGIANPGTLTYSQGTILGSFKRWIPSAGINYLFPVGTINHNRGIHIKPNNLTDQGALTVAFVAEAPGDAGLPLNDNGEDIYAAFTEGYWSVTSAEGLTSNDYDTELKTSGFTSYTVEEVTRVLIRDNENTDWRVEGSHVNASGDTIKRQNLVSLPAHLAAGDTTSCDPPVTSAISGPDSVCVNASGITYSVNNSSGSTYTWNVTGGSVNSGQGTHSISVSWNNSSAPGLVKVTEYDGCVEGEAVTLTVHKHTRPPAEIMGNTTVSENSTNVLYHVEAQPGYSYNWSVNNGATIVSGQGSDSIRVDWAGPGIESVEVIASSSCGTTQPVTLSVTVYGLINSIQTGDWNDENTWDCACVPSSIDNVILNNNHTVSLTDNRSIGNIVIVGQLDHNGADLTVNGNYKNDGSQYGNGYLTLNGNETQLDGTGSISISGNAIIDNFNKTVVSGSELTFGAGTELIISEGLTVTNKGKVTVAGDLTGLDAGSSWKNESGSVLIAGSTLLTTGTLIAGATGSTIEYNGSGAQQVKIPQNLSYHHLKITGSNTKTLTGSIKILGDLTIESTLDANSYGIELLGNWNNTGTFTPGNGNVALSGIVDQTISTPQGETYHILLLEKSSGLVNAFNGITIEDSLHLGGGSIALNGDTLTIGTGTNNTGAISRTSGHVTGVIHRWVESPKVEYFFPLGFGGYDRFARIHFHSISAGGSVYLSFSDQDPGTQGLPLQDAGQDIFFTFNEGYWNAATSGGITTPGFDLELTASGFTTFPLHDSTRIFTRTNASSNWTADGDHKDGENGIVKRDNMTIIPGQYALADTTACESPDVSLINGPDSVCVNDVNITYSIDNPDQSSNYIWEVTGGNIISGQGTDAVTVTWNSNGGIFSIKVTQTNSCQYSDNHQMPVEIHPLPTSSIHGRTNVGENSEGITYEVTGRTGYTYDWSISGGTIASGQGSANITVDWGSTGQGAVNVVGSTGCGSADTVSLSINIYPDITSVQSGNWNSTSTWDCSCIPQSNDNVAIDAGHTVTLTSNRVITNIEIRSGAVLDNQGNVFSAYGTYRVDGVHQGTNRTELWGNNSEIRGTGTIDLSGAFRILNSNKQIHRNADILHNKGSFFIGSGLTVTNHGTYSLSIPLIGDGGSSWVNDSGAVLRIDSTIFPGSGGVLNASAKNNSVEFRGNYDQDILTPADHKYYNLKVSGNHSKTLQDSIIISGILDIDAGTEFSAGSVPYNIALQSDIINNGTFSANNNRIYFTGNTEISGSAMTSFHDITISDTLTGRAAASFNVSGEWINNGFFDHNQGTVTFNGGTQNINGTTDFNNLNIGSGSNTDLANGDVTIRSMLLSDGILSANGRLILLSTEDRTALIDGSGTGEVTGTVTVQRYIPSGFGYTYIASPFSNATVNDLSAFVNLNADFPRLFKYEETSTSSGWVKYTETSDTLNPGTGYAANLGSDSTEVTIEFSGIVNNGSVTKQLTNSNNDFTDGFNLVGNPYPSPVNWDASSGWTKTNLDDAIYFFNASDSDLYGGTYSSRVNSITTGQGSDTIAAMQGFFVRVSDSESNGTLEFTNSVRVNALDPVFHKDETETKEERMLIKLGACRGDCKGHTDETVIYFDDKPEAAFNAGWDAVKKMNTDLMATNLYSYSGNRDNQKKLAIQALPDDKKQSRIIPLGFEVHEKGEYTIKASEIINLDFNTEVYLEDLKRGVTQNLRSNPEYTFKAEKKAYHDRFRIIFAPDGKIDYFPGMDEKGYFEAFSYRKNLFIHIDHPDKIPGRIMVYDMNGRRVFEKANLENGHYRLTMDVQTGIYIVAGYFNSDKETVKVMFRE